MKSWENLEADEDLILSTHMTKGRQGHKVDKIVVHHNAGNLTARQIYDVWQTREASAHYQVDANGRISQHVWDTDTAWHTGDWASNLTSIGVEHADISSSPWMLSEATLDNGAHLVGGVLFADGGILFVKYAKEPFPAGENVIVQKLHPVKAHDQPHGIQLVVVTAAAARSVVLLYYGELPPEDLRQKIPVAAGRLQKPGIDALCFRSHQIAHGPDLPLGGKDLAVVGNALSGLDLLFRHALPPLR